jgi:hypothetical protein
MDHGVAFTGLECVEDEAASSERDDVLRGDVLVSPVIYEPALGDGAQPRRRDNLWAPTRNEMKP